MVKKVKKNKPKSKAIIREFKDTPFASLTYWEDRLGENKGLNVQGFSKHKKNSTKAFVIPV